jgi:hypothetical protein
VSPLEKLFRLEIDFHRRLRTQAPGTADARALHTSFALQSGYEPLIHEIGSITEADLRAMHDHLLLTGDPRDVLEACKSLRQCLSL